MRAFRAEHFNFAQITGQTILLNGMSQASKEGIARQHQAHQVTLGAAAGEYARIACRITHLLTKPFDQFDLNDRGRRALVPGVHTLVSGVDQHFRRLANHQTWAVQVRHALSMVNQQAVFEKVFNRTLNSGLVAQALRRKIQVDTFTQLLNGFALIHLRLLQPFNDRLRTLLDSVLIGGDALRRAGQNRVYV